MNSRVDRLIARAERAHTPFVGPAWLQLGKSHTFAVGLHLAPFVDILARLRATGKHIARSTDNSIPREVYLSIAGISLESRGDGAVLVKCEPVYFAEAPMLKHTYLIHTITSDSLHLPSIASIGQEDRL